MLCEALEEKNCKYVIHPKEDKAFIRLAEDMRMLCIGNTAGAAVNRKFDSFKKWKR